MKDPRHLLLVEDDATTRDLLALLLAADGWTVTEAADGELAVRALQQANPLPQAVLCDLHLPGLQGSALAAAMQGAAARNNIAASNGAATPRLLAMTATRTAALPAGYDALLVKPFDAAAVRRAVAGTAAFAVAPAPAAAEPGALDLPAFHRLLGSMGAIQTQALFDFALCDGEDRIRRMQAAHAAGDQALLRTEAHTLKGSCSMIGAARLRALAAACEQPDALIPSNTFAEMSEAVAQIRHMLKALLDVPSPTPPHTGRI